MNSRREFLKKAALLTGAVGLPNVIPMSIQQAMAISAEPGSTFYDAEHVVFLMQENRSFDHMFGKMRGVRGFNDPRAFTKPDGETVWLQKDNAGNRYAPFHADINKTKITWQGGLPHSWNDQVAARNKGAYDKWVPIKTSMCLAYYDREDIPFYYAMADAFTICDHNFCSSLTGTTPNRLFFWTGTIRPEQNGTSVAAVNNSQAESRKDVYVDWETFPEILEDNNISWKIYQNELWTADLPGDTVDDWLGNYGDNALEYVKRYQVRLAEYFRKHGDQKTDTKLTATQVQEKYNRLSSKEKNLIDKAFATNINAPDDYLALSPFSYQDDTGVPQSMNIPRNDIFYQFRKDVDEGKLPSVSWLVAPQRFSDHTSSPLYGTWYVSEAINILTKNPEVWKKTIFILTYDENDGYFDHMPPYVVPKPGTTDTGMVSGKIDITPDYEMQKDSPIGLGYRIPMIVASPWSMGGYVNSQVFDHTSCLMFLENWLGKKTGKTIFSPNISSWRRAICGDLTSVFRPEPANVPNDDPAMPPPLQQAVVMTDINNAKNKPPKAKPTPLTPEELKTKAYIPLQESGTRPACAIPYQLYAECQLNKTGKQLEIRFETGKGSFGQKISPAGAPFCLYTSQKYQEQSGKIWNYALQASDILTDRIAIDNFKQGRYHLCVTAPNGFFRDFKGSKQDPELNVRCDFERSGLLNNKLTGHVELLVENSGSTSMKIKVVDNSYHQHTITASLRPKQKTKLLINLTNSSGWYDFTVRVDGNDLFSRQYAGHVETGETSVTDPLMAGLR
jgi:phospholipase C